MEHLSFLNDCYQFSLTPGMVFDYFEWFQKCCLICHHTRDPQSMPQIQFLRVSAFRMISTGSLWNNWAFWVDEIYFSWYLAWFRINLSDLRRLTLFSITLEAFKVCSKFYVGCFRVVLRDDRTVLEVGHMNFFADSENIAFGLLKNDFG